MTQPKQMAWRKSLVLSSAKVTASALLLLVVMQISVHAQWNTSGNNINNTNSGNVGIGTGASTPGDKLVVIGNSLVGNITNHTQLYSTYDSQSNVVFELGYGTATSNITPLASLVLSKNLTSTNNAVGNIFFANSSIADGSEKRLSGIGSWTDGATNSGTLNFYTTGAGTLAERMRLTSAGNLGLGTTSPGELLHSYTPSSVNVFQSQAGSGSAGFVGVWDQGGLFLSNNRNTRTGNNFNSTVAGAQLGIGNTGDGNRGDFAFSTTSTGATPTTTELVRIKASGNVGIGTASPTLKLHVVGDGKFTGNLTVDGNIAAKYQDVAEWVESSQSLSAGTVVVLDQTRSNQVVSSSSAYDTRVAGVISLQPGIALGEKSNSKVLVATTGRVKVKVDATSAPIQIGDLLVTSDIAGVAKKSEPLMLGGVQMHRPGTLIGKALEPLEKGTGEILVLLSLQ